MRGSQIPQNELRVKIYSRLSVDIVPDHDDLLDNVIISRYSTFYPGGIYGNARIVIPLDITRNHPWRGGQRVEITNGMTQVWEGEIVFIGFQFGSGAKQALVIEAVGYWGALLKKRSLDKRWADNRMSAKVWYFASGGAVAVIPDKFSIDRHNRIRVVPKKEEFNTYDRHTFHYVMPDGETVKRITWNYDMDEASQTWRITMKRAGTPYSGTGEDNVTTTSSGSKNVTLGIASKYAFFEFVSDATQTPPQNGSTDDQIYMQISNLMVYSETGTITPESIAGDIIALFSEIDSWDGLISANTFTLEPFFSDGPEPVADILLRVAAHGDSSFNPWGFSLMGSEESPNRDGNPVLKFAQYPSLDSGDAEYTIGIDDPNLIADFRISQDFDDIINYVYVERTTENDSFVEITTPNDDAALKDTDSISLYGQKEFTVKAGTTGASVALSIGKRILAQKKDVRFMVSGPIKVRGYLMGEDGEVPASKVKAGTRIRITTFREDLADVSDAGLTFLITATTYNPDKQELSISTGLPDDLAVFMAQRKLRENAILGR